MTTGRKPRLTSFHDLQDLVAELQTKGLDEVNLYQKLTEIGVIDLDVLNDVMKRQDSLSAEKKSA